MNKNEKKVEPTSENGNSTKPDVSGSAATFGKCPECLQPTPIDELNTFGGLCEECSGAFDE